MTNEFRIRRYIGKKSVIFCYESGINTHYLIFQLALEFTGRIKLTVLQVSNQMYISRGREKNLSVADKKAELQVTL